eukprot:scaffold880_cov132-Cylindrotheca_fusiformis.AAC.38
MVYFSRMQGSKINVFSIATACNVFGKCCVGSAAELETKDAALLITVGNVPNALRTDSGGKRARASSYFS